MSAYFSLFSFCLLNTKTKERDLLHFIQNASFLIWNVSVKQAPNQDYVLFFNHRSIPQLPKPGQWREQLLIYCFGQGLYKMTFNVLLLLYTFKYQRAFYFLKGISTYIRRRSQICLDISLLKPPISAMPLSVGIIQSCGLYQFCCHLPYQ